MVVITSIEDKALFESVYPHYELDMAVEAILDLGIPVEQLSAFLEYAEPLKVKALFENAYPQYLLNMSEQAIQDLGIPAVRVDAFLQYVEQRKIKAAFENAYPQSEIGMSEEKLQGLGIPVNQISAFQEYAEQRRKAETRQLRLTVHNLSDATRLSINIASKLDTPLSPTEEFTLEKFNKEFHSAKERATLNDLYVKLLEDGEALKYLYDDPKHAALALRFDYYANFRGMGVGAPVEPKKRDRKPLFQFFTPLQQDSADSEHTRSHSGWFCCH